MQRKEKDWYAEVQMIDLDCGDLAGQA